MINQVQLHIMMATMLMKNYESGAVSAANTVRQIHHWVKSCPEASAVIPPESSVAAELRMFQSYELTLGIDLLSIGHICIQIHDSVQQKLDSQILMVSCLGNATAALDDGLNRIERIHHVGLAVYGRMERVVIELCKRLADGSWWHQSSDPNNPTKVVLKVDSGKGFHDVATWWYGKDSTPPPLFLVDLIQITSEIISACIPTSCP